MQHYWDPHSWFGGFVKLCFFTDYVTGAKEEYIMHIYIYIYLSIYFKYIYKYIMYIYIYIYTFNVVIYLYIGTRMV